MKLKQIGALFLSVMLILNNISFAVENKLDEIVEDTNITMTLSEAVSYALIHNANVVDINKMVDDQKELYDNAVSTYRIWKEKVRNGGYSFENAVEYMDCWGYSLELAKLSYDAFLSNKGSIEETIGYSVKMMSYSIDELEKAILLLEKTIVKQENDVKIAEVKNSLNMITSLDVETAKQTLTSTKLQLDSLKSTLSSLKTSLKSIMGLDVSKELNITLPEEELTILEIEDLATKIEESLETNSDVIAAKLSYKPKEINYILATQTHLFIKDEIKDAKKEYSDAELRLNNSINQVKNNLYSLYNQVKTSEGNVILKKDEYDQIKIKERQMEVMYELGMISKHDFDSFELALISAKNTYESALHENILLNERFNIALKYGDVIGKGENGSEN